MKSLIRIFAIVPTALFLCAAYCVFSSPPEPAFAALDKALVIARLNHLFLIAAYSMVWAIQLGYVAWLGHKWLAQKQEAIRAGRELH